MLNLYFGPCDKIGEREVVGLPSIYFDMDYEEEWLKDELVKEMILDIDKSEVISDRIIGSPFLGLVSPTELSAGVKTLILLLKDDSKIFNATSCGDNCAKWILKISEIKNLTINLRYFMDFGKDGYKINLLREGKIVDNIFDFISEVKSFEEEYGEMYEG